MRNAVFAHHRCTQIHSLPREPREIDIIDRQRHLSGRRDSRTPARLNFRRLSIMWRGFQFQEGRGLLVVLLLPKERILALRLTL